MVKKIKWVKSCIRVIATAFLLMNVLAIFHAYKFTHFAAAEKDKTKDPKQLNTGQKIKTMVLGVSNPRPENARLPEGKYQILKLRSNETIECWDIRTQNAKGTVILFHGFGGNKSALLDQAAIFRELGYHTLLVDFMGSGGSDGNCTTIGYKEAVQVKACYEYISKTGEKNIYLFGTSMGAVAIMKAIKDYSIQAKGIIIECPFGTMYETVCARFRIMKAPVFPMAGLLVFWGGIENGFWAFTHNPTTYARKITSPTLLLYGAKDDKVSKEEINGIFSNLAGKKQLKIYPEAGHENYLRKYSREWKEDVRVFLEGE